MNLTDLTTHHPESYIKGGYVRDLVWGIPSRDIDFVCVGDYDELLEKFDEVFDWAIPMGKSHGTLVFKNGDEKYEVNVVESINNIHLNCDYTMNSLLLTANNDIIADPEFIRHTKERVLERTHDTALSDDPVRCIRGIRFMWNYNCVPTVQVAEDWKHILPQTVLCDDTMKYCVSKYRSWNELRKCFESEHAMNILLSLQSSGLRSPFRAPKSWQWKEEWQYKLGRSLEYLNEAQRKLVYKQYGVKMVDRAKAEDHLTRHLTILNRA